MKHGTLLNSIIRPLTLSVVVILIFVFNANAQTAVPMASQPGSTYTENFADITNWTNGFAAGIGANRWGSVIVNATGTIGDGVKISTSTATFTTTTSGGVQKGTGNIQLLSTGTANSCAIDFYVNFSTVSANTISFDVATVFNSTGDRDSKLKLFYSTNNGSTWTEITGTNLPYTARNNVAGSASISVSLPSALNNISNARFRFYEYSTATGGVPGGSQPKISIDNVTVTAIPCTPPTISIGTTTNILCNGASTGAINLNASGATSYAWSGPSSYTATSQNISGLAAGTYTVIATSTPGCTSSATSTLTQPSAIVPVASSNTPVCSGNNLLLTGSATSGTGPYTYAWSGPNTFSSSTQSPTISGATTAATGTYTVVVTDANSCTKSATTAVIVNATPTVSITPSAPSVCLGSSKTLTASGATTYIWATNGTLNTTSGATVIATPITTTTYTVTGTSTGCSSSASVTVTVNSLPTATCSSSNVTVANGNNGSATVLASGGSGTYTYTWTNSAQTTSTITNLTANTYVATVTDGNGCTATCSSVVTQPANALVANCSVVTNVTCNGGNNGSATANPTGGTSPYTYSWSSGSTNQTITGRTAGIYVVTVTDAASATATCSLTITQPSAVVVAPTSNAPLCSGSTLNLVANASGGVAPYSYSWNGVNSFTSATANPSIASTTSINSGAYNVVVTDASGCTGSGSISAVINTATISSSASPASICAGSSSTLTATGGVSYVWATNGTLNTTSGASVIATPLVTTTYSVTGTDVNGCSASSSVTVTVTTPTISVSPTSYTLLSGRSLTLSTTGNATSYSWTPGGQTTASIIVTPTSNTSYVVTGTINGCSATATSTVNVVTTYGAGNLVTQRVGDGSAALSSSSTPLFLDEFSTGGSLVRTTIIPTTGSNRLVTSGNSGTEGQITRASNNQTIVLAGYDALTGVTSISSSTSVAAPRAIDVVNYAQNITRVITSSSYSGTSFRSATSDGTNYWGSAGTGGTILLNSNTTIQSSSTNNRNIAIFNGQLYFATGAGTRGVYAVGTGLPTTAATATIKIALTQFTTPSPEGFSINPASTIGYVTDDASFGISKYTFNGTTWSLAYIIPIGIATRGLVVDYSQTNPIIYVTTSEAAANRILKVVDMGSAANFTSATLATAPANTAFRGLAFAPECPIAAKPVITIDNIINACQGGTNGGVNISISGGNAPYSYTWTNGSTAEDISAVASNTYSVLVMDNSGCSSNATATVGSIAAPTPVISGSTSFCIGGSTILDAGSGYSSYLWSTGATTQTITASAITTYSVTVTNASGCSGSSSITTTNYASPTPTITGNFTFCSGGSTVLNAGAYSAYSWSTGATTQLITVNTPGTYTVTVTNANGCTASTSATVTLVAGVTPTITGNLAYCFGGSTTLSTDLGFDTYSWSPGGQTTSSIVVNSPGSYTVSVTSGACNGSATVTVVQNSLPIISVSPSSATICNGQSQSLTASGASTYLWSPSTSLNSTNTATVIANPSSNITYLVTGTNGNGCVSSTSVVITVNALPTVSVTPTIQSMCSGSSLTITASGDATSYAWTPATGLNTTTGTSVITTVSSNTIYTVTGTNANGCTATATSSVVVVPGYAAPLVTSSYLYCQNATAAQLTAIANPSNSTLLWYTVPTGGVSSTTAPTPNTSVSGVQNYYVSQTENQNAIKIAITGMIDNGTPDIFSFVALTDIPAGTKIYFTDNGWTGVKFNGALPLSNYKGTEDLCKFTANLTIPKGTVIISYTSNLAYAWTTSGLINPSVGTANNQFAQLSLATAGDQIYAFMSNSAVDPLNNPTTHLFVLDDTYGFEAATSSNEGAIPPGLSIADGTAVTMSHNNYYNLINDNFIRSSTQWLQYAGDTLNYTRITGSNGSLPALTTTSYSVAVACEGPRSHIQVTIQAAPIPDATVNSPVCAGGNINLSADPNYLYNVSWTGPNSFSSVDQAPTITGATTVNAGNYTVVATDFNGCTASQTVSVVVSQVIVSLSATPILCNGGTSTVTVTASGGTSPYTGTGTFTTTAGTQTYTVTDFNSCTGSNSIIISQPSAIVVSATVTTPIACAGGNATVSVSATGGTGSYTGTGTFSAAAGSHTYVVTDANSCSSSTTITVTEPTAVVVTATQTIPIACAGGNATISVSATGGTGSYTGTGTFSAAAGSHTYVVTDANSCSGSTTITVTEPPATTISSFTPISGCVGSTVTVYGQNFNSINAVDINGIVATFVLVSATEITVTVPAMATSGLITVTTTANCSASTTSAFTITNCSTGMTLNLKAYLQGYYIGGGMMQSVLLNQQVVGATSAQSDTIQVEIYQWDGINPPVLSGTTKSVLMVDGTASATLNGATNGSYYIAIRHRNSVLTWSSVPVALSTSTPASYDFSTSPTQSMSGSAADVFTEGIYSIYSGDINQDEFVDLYDYPQLDLDNYNFVFFTYVNTDLNGDGFVDLYDYPILDLNNYNFVFSSHP